ncbi:MAG: hypothetical protein K6B65_01745 [Bacilli bacterium]|nr:hypothetical protein [Bacilli bacterium]
MEVAKKRKYIVPTIIFLVFAVILAIIATIILPANVKEAVAEANENSGNDGSAIIVAPFVAVIMVLLIFFSFAAAIIALPLLILNSFLGLRSHILWVRILSIITEVLYVYVIGVAIFKLIQFLIG